MQRPAKGPSDREEHPRPECRVIFGAISFRSNQVKEQAV